MLENTGGGAPPTPVGLTACPPARPPRGAASRGQGLTARCSSSRSSNRSPRPRPISVPCG
eukprot:scaffold5888_cov62-Phaeocystis_antarctica.AAC.1